MNTLYKFLILFLLIPQWMPAHTEQGKFSKQKTITKAWTVNPDALVDIENSFGNIYIAKSEDNQVQIEVVIKVSGDSEKWVTEKLENIDIETKAFKHLVSARTVFGGSSRKSSGRNSIQVNYTVRIPNAAGVHLYNKYGNIYTPDLSGIADFRLQYGKISTGKLSGSSSFDLQYVDEAEIARTTVCQLEAQYSKVRMQGFTTLKVRSDYSDLDTGNGNTLNYDGNYGKLIVGAVSTLSAAGNYLTININQSEGTAKLTGNYNKIHLGLAKDWDTCFIEGNYLNTVLSYGSSRGFSFNLSGNYATIKTDAPATVKKSSYHVQYSGTYGSSGGTLRVSGDYLHVNLNKN